MLRYAQHDSHRFFSDRPREGWRPERTKAGMSMKIKDMSIYDRPSRFLDTGNVADFAPRDAGETNPRGLSYAVASRYKNSGTNKPKPLIFPAVYQLQRKPACFSANLNADEDDPSRIRSLKSFDAPSHASMRELARESRRAGRRSAARGPDARRGRCHGHLGGWSAASDSRTEDLLFVCLRWGPADALGFGRRGGGLWGAGRSS